MDDLCAEEEAAEQHPYFPHEVQTFFLISLSWAAPGCKNTLAYIIPSSPLKERVRAKSEDIMIIHSQFDPAYCNGLVKDDLPAAGTTHVL